jgi:hypothetical protein
MKVPLAVHVVEPLHDLVSDLRGTRVCNEAREHKVQPHGVDIVSGASRCGTCMSV